MLRPRRTTRNKNTNINDAPENNNNTNILPSHDDPDTSDDNISPELHVPISSNIAATSETSTNSDNSISDIPLGVKRYIEAAFEKQTRELKALFQHLNNTTSVSSNKAHNLETDSDANSNHATNLYFDRNQVNADTLTNPNNEHDHRINHRTSKRPPPITSTNIDNIINNRNNKKPRKAQGEQHDTNSTSLKEVEDLLQNRTQRDASNTASSLPTLDPTFFPFLSRTSLAQEQEDYMSNQHDSEPLPAYFSWSFQNYNPIDYKDNNYDLTSEVKQITNPIARETEKTRLW